MSEQEPEFRTMEVVLKSGNLRIIVEPKLKRNCIFATSEEQAEKIFKELTELCLNRKT
jgi:hypothetical protein